MKNNCPEASVLNTALVTVNTKGKVSPAKSATSAPAAAHQGVCWKSFLQEEKSDLTLLVGCIQIKAQDKMANSEQKLKGERREARLLTAKNASSKSQKPKLFFLLSLCNT